MTDQHDTPSALNSVSFLIAFSLTRLQEKQDIPAQDSMQDSTQRDDCSVTPLPTEPMTPGGPHFAEVDAEGCIDEGRGGIPNPSHLDRSPHQQKTILHVSKCRPYM